MDLAYIAVFAAIIIVLGAVSIPVGTAGVPIVLQNMGILLAAFILGGTRGGLAVALFLGVGLVGVPNLAGWRPTLAALPGPTVGYLAGYLISAFIIGYAADRIVRSHRRAARSPLGLLAALILLGLIGTVIQYLCGSVGLVARTPPGFHGRPYCKHTFHHRRYPQNRRRCSYRHWCYSLGPRSRTHRSGFPAARSRRCAISSGDHPLSSCSRDPPATPRTSPFDSQMSMWM